MTCARSMRVHSEPAACQSLIQKVRVGPCTAKVEPSFITARGSATVPARKVSSSSGMCGRKLSNCAITPAASISAGGSSMGSSPSSRRRDSVCWFLFFTTGISLFALLQEIEAGGGFDGGDDDGREVVAARAVEDEREDDEHGAHDERRDAQKFVQTLVEGHSPTVSGRGRLQAALQVLAQVRDLDALLLPGVTVAHGDGLVFERLVVDR